MSLPRSLFEKVRRLEKSTPLPVVAVVTNMRCALHFTSPIYSPDTVKTEERIFAALTYYTEKFTRVYPVGNVCETIFTPGWLLFFV